MRYSSYTIFKQHSSRNHLRNNWLLDNKLNKSLTFVGFIFCKHHLSAEPNMRFDVVIS